MIYEYRSPVTNELVWIGPIGDDIPLATWRGETFEELDRIPYDYPQKGCHGTPLLVDCTAEHCRNGLKFDSPFFYKGYSCGTCSGTGKVPADYPSRRNIP